MNTQCLELTKDIVGILDGTASESLLEHVAKCDSCRDAKHDLASRAQRIAKAGDDFVVDKPLAARLADMAREAEQAVTAAERERVSETRVRTTASPPITAPVLSATKKSRKATWLLIAACASVGVSVAAGFALAGKHMTTPEAIASRPWHGKVAAVARSGADKTGGLFYDAGSGKNPLADGAELKSGMKISTDGRTRARLELDDGTFVVLDRATEISMESAPRTMKLNDGAILIDVAHIDNAPLAHVMTSAADVKVLGTKLTITATPERTNVEVLRGEVEMTGKSAGKAQKIAAGQEGVVGADGNIDVAPVNDLAQRAAFGEQLISTHNEDTEASASGLGELRAKKPGQTNEKDRAVRLAKHAVKVRIAGNVARTEIDEVFHNDTDDELEGLYRFPLPPNAQIEKLSLEVDGKMVEGEFVDKAKAAAIWRGAIQNATPLAPKPREEIVWVPGPWHDPALLEWVRGGRFELKIFPIPKRGERRVQIAYTETVAPTQGIRRYVYPLPQGTSSKITIDSFSVDARVAGHDAKEPVRARGYEMEKKTEGDADRLTANMSQFTPSGDLAIEYALADRESDATAWAYTDSNPDPKVGSDPFVAIALRPKLPKWRDQQKRDQVIVVDSGRAMFGERFARAKRLAVQLVQEMDRRDRVTVLACDVTCKAMSGFSAPGAPAAHDVDAFLTGVTPDGASDLVSAVRNAAVVKGHEKDRDLRLIMLSDGVATAGYRAGSRIASEVGEALADSKGEVVTVPIGADADTTLLGEVARGGGGVVVPYQPGQRLESTALEVLNATYGTTLRDVEIVLPDGLKEAAPASLPPLRAGSETIVTARLTGTEVRGDVIVRGKVGGDPFEAKYPIQLKTTTDAGNAFVPRLFAAARIADRERDATEDQRTELVALSRRFGVPSKFTSLLVLESEAMFKAFGIDRTNRAAAWTGETVGQGFANGHGASGTLGRLEGGSRDGKDKSVEDPFGADEEKSAKLDLGGIGQGGGGKGSLGDALASSSAPADTAAAKPAKKAAAPPPPMTAPAAEAAPATAGAARAFDDRDWNRQRRNPRGGQFMKRIFVRKASIATDATPAIAADKVAAARAAVQATPDERGKHKELARTLALSGQLDELADVLSKWSEKDPLDVDVITSRADLAARRGDREASLRILGGALAASALDPKEAFTLATNVARGYERLGRPEACSFHVTAAEIRPTDADAVARAVSCERGQGRGNAAERWLSGMKDAQRKAVDAAITKVASTTANDANGGDVVVSATWDGGQDLDVVLIDPNGRRAGVASRLKGTRVEGAQSRDHETVGLSTNESGAFVVEMARASNDSTSPVSGKVTIRAFGKSQVVPFTLTGARTSVARIDVGWEAQLVPVNVDSDDQPILGTSPGTGPFDRTAAASALNLSVSQCALGNLTGTGHANVTFAPAGNVSAVVVDDANFAGSDAGRCVQRVLARARVPAFTGSPVTVGKSFTIPAR